MPDDSTVTLAAVGGLLAAEATGVTNFVGGGDGDGGGGPSVVGGIPPGLAEAFQSAAGASGTLPSFDLSVPTAGTDGGGTDVTKIINEATEQIPTPDDLTDGLTFDRPQLADVFNPQNGDRMTDTPDGLDTSTSEEFDLQDLAGTGPIGTSLATAGEIGASSGDLVGDVLDAGADNPIATAGVAGGVAAAPFTGGLSVPLAIGAAGIGGQAAADAGAS